MVRQSRAEWKTGYFRKLSRQLADCEKCFIVNVDNVSSRQMQQVRLALRGKAEIVLGKNTMMKKVIHTQLTRNSNLEKLLPHVHENVGFIFTKCDLLEVRSTLEANRVAAPAKAKTLAQCDVIVPAQNTGLGPEKTSFFQALNIPTKIARGSIEILTDVHLLTKNAPVGMSEATLLNMLKIYPFTYGLVIKQVYDKGSVYDPEVLDITPTIILEKFLIGARNITAVSLATGYTTQASVPQLVIKGFLELLAISMATEFTISQAEQIKAYIADPTRFTVASAPAPTGEAAEANEALAAEIAAAPAESGSDSDMGFGLFD